MAVLFVIIAIGGLMVVQVRSSAENITSSVRDARQVENEWASTSKKDHKVSKKDAHVVLTLVSIVLIVRQYLKKSKNRVLQ